jgi:predicted O-linked N-acetylglucosamine transferase (SPINDLY family)
MFETQVAPLDDMIAPLLDAVRREPGSAMAHCALGQAWRQGGRPDAAIPCFERAIAIEPGHAKARALLASALNEAGVRLRRQKKPGEAVMLYRRALELEPDEPGFLYNLGNALGDAGQTDPAIASYRRAVEIKPDFAAAWHSLGNRLWTLRRANEALAAHRRAIEIDPGFAEAHCDLANVLVAQRYFDRALDHFRRAAELKPDHLATHYNMGNLLVDMSRREEAIAAFGRVLEIDPDFVRARAKKLHQQAIIGDWRALAAAAEAIEQLGIDGDAVTPFSMLAMEDAPERHRTRSERYVRQRFPQAGLGPFARPADRPERLRIGYFSADFAGHPTMQLLARMFELHDRSRFTTFAYSYGLVNEDGMHQRLTADGSFDQFREVRMLGDRAIAELARADGIDIAIDLTGHTSRNRLGMFAHRCAPVQIHYLGYPGTIGASFIDYAIVDRIIVPETERDTFTEKLIFLPHQYQAQDDRLAPSQRPWTRSELGLPADGFVFCALNNSYKIGPRELAIWARLLAAVEGSVLWLLRSDPIFARNVAGFMAAHGIAADRLVFYEHHPIEDYLAHLALADLFLDSFTYNAGATASHALWAGLPLVTRIGRGYPARMAASLLSAAGLGELITTSDADYERLALSLATAPARLAALRARLAANRDSQPLFDSAGFTLHIEAAYDAAWQRWFEGLEPADIDLAGG